VHGGYFLVGCRPVDAPRKLNLHCLLGSTTYLTRMEGTDSRSV